MQPSACNPMSTSSRTPSCSARDHRTRSPGLTQGMTSPCCCTGPHRASGASVASSSTCRHALARQPARHRRRGDVTRAAPDRPRTRRRRARADPSLLSQADPRPCRSRRAAGIVGALYSSADATPFDAFRTASLVRQLQATVVIGSTARCSTQWTIPLPGWARCLPSFCSKL